VLFAESMSESLKVAANPADDSRKASFLQRKLPFVVLLVLAIVGVAYTNISQQPLAGYWEFLALATGVVCVVTQWASARDKEAHLRLMITQALHWTAIFTMNIVLLSGVQSMLPAPATGLVLLTLLALGTFLAGVNFLSLQICFLGVATAVAVPAIAWLKQSVLFLLLAAVLVIGLVMTFWPRQAEERPAPPAHVRAPMGKPGLRGHFGRQSSVRASRDQMPSTLLSMRVRALST
jgi:hypothetical protein